MDTALRLVFVLLHWKGKMLQDMLHIIMSVEHESITNTLYSNNTSITYTRGRQPTACQGILPSLRPFIVIWPTILFLFSMTDMHQKNAENLSCGLCQLLGRKMLEFLVKIFFFWSSPSFGSKKGLNFWQKPFSFGPLEWWRHAGTLLGLNVAH